MTNEQKSQPEVERSSHTVEATESWGTQHQGADGGTGKEPKSDDRQDNPTQEQGTADHPDPLQAGVRAPIQEPDPQQHRSEE